MDLALFDLEVDPTIAMQRGDQSVFQCAFCGTVVVQPRPASHRLLACPCCSRNPAEWIKQRLPVAGIRASHSLSTTREGESK